MQYYKKHIGDYAKKAGRLSMLQHGAYTLLIDACYDRERFPTLDDAIEWTWASTQEEIDAVNFVLRKFFTLSDCLYVQKRIEQTLQEYQGQCIVNGINGKLGGRPKDKNKPKETQPVNLETQPVNLETDSQPNRNPTVSLTTNHKPLTTNHKPLTTNHKPLTNNHIKNKTSNSTAVDFSMLGFTDQQVSELKRIRKANKGGAITQRVANALAKEFNKAIPLGFSFDDSLTEWEMRGWKSFKSEWIKSKGVDYGSQKIGFAERQREQAKGVLQKTHGKP